MTKMEYKGRNNNSCFSGCIIVIATIIGLYFLFDWAKSQNWGRPQNLGQTAFTIANGRLNLTKYPCSFDILPKQWVFTKPSTPECQACFQRDEMYLEIFVYPGQDCSALVSKLTANTSELNRTMPYEPIRRTFGKKPPYFGLSVVTNGRLKDKQGRTEAEPAVAEAFALIPMNGSVLVVSHKCSINPNHHYPENKNFEESLLGSSLKEYGQFINSVRLHMPSPMRTQSKDRVTFPGYGFSLVNLPTSWRSIPCGSDLLAYHKGASVIRVSIQVFGPYKETEFLNLVDLRNDPGRRNFRQPQRVMPVLPGQHELVGEYTFGVIHSLYVISERDRLANNKTEKVFEYAALVVLKKPQPNPRTVLFTIETVITDGGIRRPSEEVLQNQKDFEKFISGMLIE